MPVELPTCKYRKAMREPGKYRCTSHCLVVGRGYVTDEDCSECPVYDLDDCYERVRGKQKHFKPKRRLGDIIAAVLRFAGITPDRVEKLTGKPCGCKGKQQALNRWHEEVARKFTGWYAEFLSLFKKPDEMSSQIRRRNLLMFVYPVRDKGGWQANADIIREHKELFNGKRVICIARNARGTMHKLDSPETVRERFGDGFEFIEVDNNKHLREVAGFLPLFEAVESTDPNEATFYCHTKGCTHDINDGATPHRWRDAMYETCLHWPSVSEALQGYPICGPFKRYGILDSSKWHFSGTFFWFRNRDVFTRNWRDIDLVWSGMESWVGKMFTSNEGGCLMGKYAPMLYDMTNMPWMESELEKWRQKHAVNS